MKEKDAAKKAIAELLGVDIASVTSKMIDRYFLGELQGWKCLYSGKEINKEECLRGSKAYEIDHIVPFSLILDNTLNNKALVLTSENQSKKQQTPLMYLSGERRKNFIGTVNELFRAKKIKKKKYAYLLQPDLNDEKMSEWKSRNLNDMRHISRFMVGYLKENLKFYNSSKSEGRWQNVYAVKGSLTSMFRKLWLNETTWGRADKASIKAETYLDHAVDAVVIGNSVSLFGFLICWLFELFTLMVCYLFLILAVYCMVNKSAVNLFAKVGNQRRNTITFLQKSANGILINVIVTADHFNALVEAIPIFGNKLSAV